jgi:iron complex outermembrane receptor protein
MKTKRLLQALSLAFVAGHAFAQERAASTERIEITGSSIKRVQEEGAFPCRSSRAEDIERRGFINAEQLLMSISANGTARTTSPRTPASSRARPIRNNNGNSSANLRWPGRLQHLCAAQRPAAS